VIKGKERSKVEINSQRQQQQRMSRASNVRSSYYKNLAIQVPTKPATESLESLLNASVIGASSLFSLSFFPVV